MFSCLVLLQEQDPEPSFPSQLYRWLHSPQWPGELPLVTPLSQVSITYKT
jgi:hypothetical protein